MSEEMILRHCSPTLAGLKTGNIITCEYESASVLYENMREWNRVLGRKASANASVELLRRKGYCLHIPPVGAAPRS